MKNALALLGLVLLFGCNSVAPAGSDSGPPRLNCTEWCFHATSGMTGTCGGTTDMAGCVTGCNATATACAAEHTAYFTCIGRTTDVCGRCITEYSAVGTCFGTYCAANPSAAGCT